MPKKSLPPVLAIPSFVSPAHLDKPLYIPHRSRSVAAEDWTPFAGAMKPQWHIHARNKGFRLHSRIRDRLHLVLECHICGALTAQKLFTLRTARPACGGCQHRARIEAAKAAGLTFLHRDDSHPGYGFYRAGCGHILRRSFAQVERVMRGETGLRCETCLQQRGEAEAQKQSWILLSEDPAGDDNYRLYQHSCGHQQRVARVNMRWGQVDCAGCGRGWSARQSFIYLARIFWPQEGLSVLKLGYSANPRKRFKHQLKLGPSAQIKILRTVPVPTGHLACQLEKQMHANLRKEFPAAIVPPAQYAGLINVITEIYWPDFEMRIQERLDQIARDHPS